MRHHPAHHRHHAMHRRHGRRFALRRRLFGWILASVVVSALAVAVATHFVQTDTARWPQLLSSGQRWVSARFSERWEDPGGRRALAEETAATLRGRVVVKDAAGTVLDAAGAASCQSQTHDLPVEVNGKSVGVVTVCDGWPREPGAMPWVAGGTFFLVLWLAAGKISRRLSRPLDELAEAVQHIGRGDLKARVPVHLRRPDEVSTVAEAINEMAERIEKQVNDQKELLAAVSHELRTPLARIRVLTELARDAGTLGAHADDFDREVQEIDALVGQLLAHSRLEFESVSKSPTGVADAALRALERAGVAPGLLSNEAGDAKINADATLFLRALANLLDNAARHGGGLRQLKLEADAQRVRVIAVDDGPGFAGLKRGEVHRGAPTTRSAVGLGLGLKLVDRIAAAHQGALTVTNLEPSGTAVALEFPRWSPPAAA